MIRELSKQILQHYGLQHQKAKTIEELGELIVALQKNLLSNQDGLSQDVLEEIADVHIMLTQLLDDEGDKLAEWARYTPTEKGEGVAYERLWKFGADGE